MKNRIIYSVGGTLTDLSDTLYNYHSGTAVKEFLTTDFIYVGMNHPFNHLYFAMETVNTTSATLTVETWDGSAWQEVAELVDGTSAFTSSGFITWTPNKYKTWTLEDTVGSTGSTNITGLGNVTIYDKYWVRITTDTNLDNTTEFSWAGHLFCTSNDVYTEYRALSLTAYLTALESGKTDYEEEIMLASREIISDMKAKRIITHKGQILSREDLMLPCIHKTAAIAYNNLGTGEEFTNMSDRARARYNQLIKKDLFSVDKNSNAVLDQEETEVRQGNLSR